MSGTFWGMGATGSGEYVRNLLSALTEVAPEEEYVLFSPRWAGASGGGDVPWTVYPLRTPFDQLGCNLAKVWCEQLAFPRACRRQAVDIAHVPYFAPPLCPSVPTVVTIHDLIPLILPGYRGSIWVRAYMRLVSVAARRATLILTDSHASARDVVRLLGIPQERLRVIHLAAGVLYRPVSPEELEPTLTRLGIPPRYLLYLGGFDRRKNVVGLLRAFARVHRGIDDVALVIAGKLPERPSAFAPDPRVVAIQMGLQGKVHCTGWVAAEDKPALYSGALALVFPSRYEGFGLPVLEAISCGTPAIVGTGSALEEVAGPGGIAVPPEDIDALASDLVRIVQDSALRHDLSVKGLEHARSFSWQKTAQRTVEAYRHALVLS